MKIAILGFARENKSVLAFLRKSPTYKKAEFWILDRNPKLQIRPNVPKGTLIITGENYLKNLSEFDLVFRTPGVPYNLPEIQRAVKKGVEFSSATKLFFETIGKMVRRGSPRVIGITGTKGKGTTATLLYKILKACNKKIYLAGNIGSPPLGLLKKTMGGPRKSVPIVILELSSFQLQDLKKSPPIAVVLEIFPDHMDAHKNMGEYIDAKTNIARYQKKTDKIFYFSDNKWAKWIASKSRGKKIPVQCRDIGCPDITKILGTSDVQKLIKIPGFHNVRNILMAATVALSLGCPKEKIIKVIKNFRGNEHRLELVRTIRIHSEHSDEFVDSDRIIRFYNDSASTNPQTAAAAIKSFASPKILICGGKDKGLNYSPLAKALKNSNTELIILFGENKNKIKKAISKSGVPIKLVQNLKTAINITYKYSKFYFLDSKFLNIIFSPASASFDMFKNYAERGKKFKELVRKLK